YAYDGVGPSGDLPSVGKKPQKGRSRNAGEKSVERERQEISAFVRRESSSHVVGGSSQPDDSGRQYRSFETIRLRARRIPRPEPRPYRDRRNGKTRGRSESRLECG